MRGREGKKKRESKKYSDIDRGGKKEEEEEEEAILQARDGVGLQEIVGVEGEEE
jgi:hypothetical protein